jgi:hypothetical protein
MELSGPRLHRGPALRRGRLAHLHARAADEACACLICRARGGFAERAHEERESKWIFCVVRPNRRHFFSPTRR